MSPSTESISARHLSRYVSPSPAAFSISYSVHVRRAAVVSWPAISMVMRSSRSSEPEASSPFMSTKKRSRDASSSAPYSRFSRSSRSSSSLVSIAYAAKPIEQGVKL